MNPIPNDAAEAASNSFANLSPTLTPMMRQYFTLRSQAQDAILLFRMGDFYEIFDQDAQLVAPKLDLVLTSREKDKGGERVSFCGVPHHSARNYISRLLAFGHKVAIADQVEDPAQAKGIVRREIVRIHTPGCAEEFEGADETRIGNPCYLAALFEEPKSRKFALLIADSVTGEMRLGSIEESSIAGWIAKFKPREILARRFYLPKLKGLLAPYASRETIAFSELPEEPLRDLESSDARLASQFGKKGLAALPCGRVEGGAELIASCLAYFKTLGMPTEHFLSVAALHAAKAMALDEAVVRDLELFETSRRRDQQGSLFHAINLCVSPMGTRLLRARLREPLIEPAEILARQETVARFAELGEGLLTSLRERLKAGSDLERLAARMVNKVLTPVELGKVRDGLQRAQAILDWGQVPEAAPIAAVLAPLKAGMGLLSSLDRVLVERPSALGDGRGVFHRGFDAKLDEYISLLENGEEAVRRFEQEEKQKTGIASLKVKHHKNFGYLLEITKSNLNKVPDRYVRRQTMVNNERFVCDELLELGLALESADANARELEGELYQRFLIELAPKALVLLDVARALAEIDWNQALAFKAIRYRYVRPRLSASGRLSIKEGRHPVIESLIGPMQFVPNDMELSGSTRQLLITGPNMAGKSTVMRQTALIAILNQIGAFVPASSAELPVFDRIFTRIGASDDLAMGQSTFMTEMSEAATVLREASATSLVILDEVGRGTSTEDGLAIAAAIFEDIVRRIRCYTLFATHYHELVPMTDGWLGVQSAQVEVIKHPGRIEFTHRLVAGAASSSYGIEVAKLAGIPAKVIVEASRRLADLERESAPQVMMLSPESRSSSLADRELYERIAELNIDRLSPLKALNILADLQGLARGQGKPPEPRPLFPV